MKTTKELIIADITAKVEAKLASQKVELGAIQDVFNKIDTISNESKKSFDVVFKAKGLLTDAKGLENNVVKQYQSVYVELTKLKGTVKDLGLPTNEIDDKLKLVKDRITQNENTLKGINQAIQIL